MIGTAVKMYDIMACNVYWDFENSPLQKEQHKFLVSFYPTPDTPTPDLIEKIEGLGPNGYKVEFKNQMFKNTNLNGWIYDPTLNYYWYMINLSTGFMKEGEYTVQVTCKNGDVMRKTRMQKNDISDAMISVYLNSRQKIYDSFSPSKTKPMPAGASLKDVRCSWLTLRSWYGGTIYIFRGSIKTIRKPGSTGDRLLSAMSWSPKHPTHTLLRSPTAMCRARPIYAFSSLIKYSRHPENPFYKSQQNEMEAAGWNNR
ncbi:MAG: hypothetical protein ACYDHZ_01635 [Dehalococcoidia bacterium]